MSNVKNAFNMIQKSKIAIILRNIEPSGEFQDNTGIGKIQS